MVESENWYISLSDAVAGLGNDRFFPRLIKAIGEYIPDLFAIVYIMPRQHAPSLKYETYPKDLKSSTKTWLFGPYLLDPFYIKSFDGSPEGLYHLDDVAPEGFVESEYYKSYYGYTGCIDEVCYITHISSDLVVSLSLSRLSGSSLFTRDELSLFRLISPLVAALMKHQFELTGYDKNENQRLFHQQLKERLDDFGKSLLTHREHQIVQLMFRGNSSKSMAKQLSLSLDTVNMHRKNAYIKLNISSQSELFSLLLDSLSVVDK